MSLYYLHYGYNMYNIILTCLEDLGALYGLNL